MADVKCKQLIACTLCALRNPDGVCDLWRTCAACVCNVESSVWRWPITDVLNIIDIRIVAVVVPFLNMSVHWGL